MEAGVAKKVKPLKVEKTRKKTDMKENIGKVFVNLGQVIFGTICLGGVLRGEIPHYIMIMSGFAGAMIFISFGLLLSAKEKKDKEV
jgi:hypothetical protein